MTVKNLRFTGFEFHTGAARGRNTTVSAVTFRMTSRELSAKRVAIQIAFQDPLTFRVRGHVLHEPFDQLQALHFA